MSRALLDAAIALLVLLGLLAVCGLGVWALFRATRGFWGRSAARRSRPVGHRTSQETQIVTDTQDAPHDANEAPTPAQSPPAAPSAAPASPPAAGAFSTNLPGLPGGPLLTTYPIHVNLIPAANTYQRPGIKAHLPRRSVQHGTGNPNNASAQAEAQYFVGGAEGRQASVHATINHQEVWVIVPLDEVTWQAADGSGPGNMNGLSSEMLEADAIWNTPAQRDAEIAIAADFMGRCAARLGIDIPEQHWTFNFDDPNRHDCPDKLRHVTIGGELAWSIYARTWNAAKADELARMNQQPTPPPTYAKPVPVPGPVTNQVIGGKQYVAIPAGTGWQTTKDAVPVRQYADPAAAPVHAPLAKGTEVDPAYLVIGEDGRLWLIDKWWGRIPMDGLMP